jgi:hypothetical protein
MTSTMFSSALETLRSAGGEHDASWYGTLGLLAACLGMLAAVSFIG